jgi:hypothetical protein
LQQSPGTEPGALRSKAGLGILNLGIAVQNAPRSGNKIIRCAGCAKALIKTFELRSQRCRRRCRYVGLPVMLWLLRKSPIEQPIMMRTDIAKIDEGWNPGIKHRQRIYAEMRRHIRPDRR